MENNRPDLKYWIAFSKCNKVGNVFIDKLYNYFGSIKEAWHATNADLLMLSSLKQSQIEAFNNEKKLINPDELLENIVKKEIKVITLEDEDYPALLKEISNPPAVLFVKGGLSSCNLERTLAIVGSRKISNYCKDTLNKIVRDIPDKRITIISGMALGADACAHRAALENNIKTIAVLGSGFDYVYPRENNDIYNKILDGNGAVLSEYYPDLQPMPWMFPHRNRIVSGLSKGTLVAEAAIKSGALITARLALEQNRDIMCIPGLITNPNTEGVYKLLKEGASIVTQASDIFECLNWEIKNNLKNEQYNIQLLDNEAKVYNTLNLEPLSLEQIISQTEIKTDELMVVLTTLELKGLIQQTGVEQYTRTLN